MAARPPPCHDRGRLDRAPGAAPPPSSVNRGSAPMTAKPVAAEISEVLIPVGEETIAGDLIIPTHAHEIVLFAHGSGSSRHSPRNRFVAEELQKAGLATLLMDLLTTAEERIDEQTGGGLRFDIGLLAGRLEAASGWVRANPSTHDLSIGYFGASTGAAAALVAADDQQGRGPHDAQRFLGQVRPASSRDNRLDLSPPFGGGGDEGGRT